MTVSDWINLAVACGTFLLASAAFYATVISRRSMSEAYRSRVDASAPKLIVVDLLVLEGIETPETVTAGNFGFAKAGEPVDLTSLGSGRLGLLVDIEVLNDGNSTALVSLDLPPDVFLKDVSDIEATTIQRTDSHRSCRNGVILLQARSRVSVKLVWRQSANVWSQEPGFPNRLPTRQVNVNLRDGTGSISDSCAIDFGGFALMPTPSKPGGWNVAPRDLRHVIAGGGSNSHANIGMVVRRYPKE